MNEDRLDYLKHIAEQKKIGNSAANKYRKGGAIMLPSDRMSDEEIAAQSSEVKTYNIKRPLKWDEFKNLPHDLKISYIKMLRQRFDVADVRLADLFGVSAWTVQQKIKELGLTKGKGWNATFFNRAEWEAFLKGGETAQEETKTTAEQPTQETQQERRTEETEPERNLAADCDLHLIPHSGTITFEGRAMDALRKCEQLLQNKYLRITITWDSFSECESVSNGRS